MRYFSGNISCLDPPTHFSPTEPCFIFPAGLALLFFFPSKQDPILTLTFTSSPTAQTVSPKGDMLIIGFQGGKILLLSPKDISQSNQKTVMGLEFNSSESTATVSSICWVPNSLYLFISGHTDGFLKVYHALQQPLVENDVQCVSKLARNSVAPGEPIMRWRVSSSGVTDMQFSYDGRWLAVCHRDGRLFVFDFITTNLELSLQSHFGGLLCVSWSPDDVLIAAGGEDDAISIWNAMEGQLLHRLESHRSWVSRLVFYPIIKNMVYTILSVGHDGIICQWEISNFVSLIDSKRIHHQPIRSLWIGFNRVATVSAENVFKIWKTRAVIDDD